MEKKANDHIIIFARYPEPGKVKTRLAVDLGPEKTADLYRLFVERTLKNLREIKCQKHLFYFPSNCEAEFKKWLADFDLKFHSQCEGNLGKKILNAFKQIAASGAAKILVIGTDSPDLPSEYINRAYAELDQNDVVIGPTRDGGYYLIGFARNRLLPEAFAGISWSTSKVFAQTMKCLQEKQQRVGVLPEWYDIDNLDDLGKLCKSNFADKSIRDFLNKISFKAVSS
jgi:rSAM/selenodomain-associated transferase 1